MKKIICILLTIAVILACICSVACVQDDNKPTIDPENKSNVYYDSITKTCKFTKSYEGKSFLNDGIGLATVEFYTDGDTTKFLTGKDTVIIRYYCIDTPESTTGVEKWGKAASLFVESRLSKATEIVLESSTGGRPVKDRYHVRYLGFVWYKTAEYDDFKLLNLELVENGFSDSNDTNSPYYDYFSKAEAFAKRYGIRKQGDDVDLMYSDKPIPMTLKDFHENTEAFYDEENNKGSKVIFTAYLESLSVSGTYMYTAASYDPETGKKYTINVYAGYTSSPSSKMKLGNLFTIIGDVQKYGGKFQISGITYNPTVENEIKNGTYTVQKKYYMTFDSSVTFISQYSDSLYSDIRVKSATVENGVLTIVGDSNQIKFENELSDVTEEFTLKVNVGENFENTFAQGDRLKLKGYQLVADSHQILVPSISDIRKK